MEAEEQLDWRTYWRQSEFGDRPVTQAYWDDPWPEIQGMLTSEYIAAYNEAVGGMIFPFNSKLLKAASYELTLGWRCMVEGKDERLSDKNPWLKIPPNSVAFVSMQQVLRLPHYVVGRFDLAIAFIYEGLLLGTGPQVDPGFQGALGCPLHNISNEAIYMQLGQPFAKLDFVKTAPPMKAARRSAYRNKVTSEAKLMETMVAATPPKWLDPEVKLFKGGKPEWRQPIYDYLRAKRPKSSVAPIRERIDRYQRFGVIGLISLVLSGGGFIVLYVQARTDRAPTERQLQNERRELDEKILDLQGRIDKLEARP